MKAETFNSESNIFSQYGASIRKALLNAGACAVGFATAAPVEPEEWEAFRAWLQHGKNAGMEYMHNYPEIRQDPRLLLDGARTVISLAFPYPRAPKREPEEGLIAAYAFGKDYHKVIRKKLKKVLSEIEILDVKPEFRICIDSAPILERYWAVKSGIGYRGRNGAIIVPGFGSYVFLAEIITNIPLPPSSPSTEKCLGCNLCIKKCPTRALSLNGEINCTHCISYLTIEHRGEWDAKGKTAMSTPHGRATLFGCDLCLSLCPHNLRLPQEFLPEFMPEERVITLHREEIIKEDPEKFKSRMAGSPISRAHYPDLLRNAKNSNQHYI